MPIVRRMQVVAHRGASEENAEHTLGAYLAALDAGADGLECDVRLTADGHLVCVHDRSLRRTAARPGTVSTMELKDLHELDVASWKNPWADLDDEAPDTDPELGRVLTLRKLLETVADCDRRVELAIETKHPTRYGGLVERRLVQLLSEFGWAGRGSPVRVMSFSYTALQRISRLAPELELVMLIEKAHHWPMLRRMVAPGWIIGPGIKELRDHPGLGRHLNGRRVFVWTVNSQADLELCQGLGVEAVITDRPAYVPRPFAGYAGECDLIALRELVPAATAPITMKDSDREVLLCSLLPMAAPAMVRDDGSIWLGLQVQHGFGDPSRDLGAVLEKALTAEEGVVGLTEPPGEGARFQDLVVDAPLEVTVHDGFDFWIAEKDRDATTAAALEQANRAAHPTARLTGVEAAYWTNVGPKEHLRWVMPEPEDALLDALARLHAAGKDELAECSRLVGMFRAHGLLVPVWDLPVGTGAAVVEEPAARFATDLAEALAVAADLTQDERSARSGLANRQVTIR